MKTAMQKGDMYKCEMCGGVFETDWSDEEAKDEYKDIHGAEPTEEQDAIVCEDCYNKIMKKSSVIN